MFELEFLKEIGLSEKESVVYLALLEVDHSSPLELAKLTKIKRPTVYAVLESLLKKGLASETTADNKTYYQAESPENLESFIERKKLTIEASKATFKKILPQLKSLRKLGGARPIVRFFEGKEGIISSNTELANLFKKTTAEEAYAIYSRDLVNSIFSKKELGDIYEKRVKAGIKSKALYTSTKGEIVSDQMSDRALLDQKKYPLKCDITIYGNLVRIAVLGNKLSGILIESADVAETMRSLFKAGFDCAKKKPPKAK